MTAEKIQCEQCSSIIRRTNIRQHQKSKKCQKAQDEKRQREQHSPVKERKESKAEKVECEWCGSSVNINNIKQHQRSKKCLSIRRLQESSKNYKCKWCNHCFPSESELNIHIDVCTKGRIYQLLEELNNERENNEDLIERHKFELKEQEKELRTYYESKMEKIEQKFERKLKEREQKFERKLNEREQEFERKLKEREQELKDELKSKDDFIKTLAKEPKYVTNTTNNNTFNLSNYFKGNNGIDFDEKLIENKIEQCRDMMLDTIDKHGFSDMKKIRDVKEKQIDILCKDDKTKKWNVVNTDASRKTYTVCKRDNDKVLTVKDPDGKMMKMIVGKMDKLNKRCYYKVLAENTHLQGSRFYELEHNCNILVKESIWDKIPTKAMLSEQEQFDDDNTITSV